jgi:hypothetical protein
MRFWAGCAVALAICTLVPVHAAAAPADVWVVKTNDNTATHNCHGGSAQIDGNDNNLTLQECVAVQVNGNNNVIFAAAPKTVNLLGNENEVTWSRGADDSRPSISNIGSRNTVKEKK